MVGSDETIDVVLTDGGVIEFLTAGFAHLQKFILKFETEVSTTKQIGSYARCGASAEGVQNPSFGLCAGLDEAHQHPEGFLSGVLATTLLPLANGGQLPHVRHLLIAIELLHQSIVIKVWNLGPLASPNDELCAVGKVAARNVWWGIGFGPRYDVENLKPKFEELMLNAEYVVVCA